MSKKHDERKDLVSVSKVARINGNHIVIANPSMIGIHTWGKIDFLVHYCGYVVNYDRMAMPSNLSFANASDKKEEMRAMKKARKEHKLTVKKR